MVRVAVLALLCFGAAWAIDIPPPADFGWQAPVCVATAPDGRTVVAASADLPRNVFLSCFGSDGSEVFTNQRIPAGYDQGALAIACGTADVAVLIEQRTMFPPFSNALLVQCIDWQRSVLWAETLLTSDQFSVPWFEPQMVRVSSQLLVTWREPGSSGGAVVHQWIDAASGLRIGVPMPAISEPVYGYALCVAETTAFVAGGSTLCRLTTDHESIVLQLQRSYNPVAVSGDGSQTLVFGVTGGVAGGEVTSPVDDTFTFDLEPIQGGTLPREVRACWPMVTYRVHADTLRAAAVYSLDPVTIGTGGTVHAHQIVRGSGGWGATWRNASGNAAWGNQLDSLGPMWGSAGDTILPMEEFAGTVPLAACGGGDFGYLAGIADGGSLTLRPIAQPSATAHPPRPEVPTTATLRAYPNPFNGAVSLRWSSARSSGGAIAIYDVLGRLVEEVAVVGYSGEARWEPSAASGSYLARFTGSDGSVATALLQYTK